MKSAQIIFALATVFITQSVMAQGQGQGQGNRPPPPGDVNVINTPDVRVINTPGVTIENATESPVPVSIVDGGGNGAQTITEYRVVGFTAATDGDITDGSLRGVAAMHSLCAAVDPSWRAAFSDEARRSPAPDLTAVTLGTEVWIIPTQPVPRFHPDAPVSTFDWIAIDHASGVILSDFHNNLQTAISSAVCAGYGNASGTLLGLGWVPHSGKIVGGLSCNFPHPIACSAPVEVPISP